jgi:hypothetical protein
MIGKHRVFLAPNFPPYASVADPTATSGASIDYRLDNCEWCWPAAEIPQHRRLDVGHSVGRIDAFGRNEAKHAQIRRINYGSPQFISGHPTRPRCPTREYPKLAFQDKDSARHLRNPNLRPSGPATAAKLRAMI